MRKDPKKVRKSTRAGAVLLFEEEEPRAGDEPDRRRVGEDHAEPGGVRRVYCTRVALRTGIRSLKRRAGSLCGCWGIRNSPPRARAIDRGYRSGDRSVALGSEKNTGSVGWSGLPAPCPCQP